MSAVSETIVREYFEMHGFFVQQQRKFISPTRKDDEEIDFLVINPRVQLQEESLPFILAANHLQSISRAVVVVKGWHTETFSTARLTTTPEILRFVEPTIFANAVRSFGKDGRILKILIVPTLPANREAATKTIELLRSKGVDAVVPFRTMLEELIEKTEPNRNYQRSDLLQIIRIFKNYGLFRDRQLELFRTKGKGKRSPRSSRTDSE